MSSANGRAAAISPIAAKTLLSEALAKPGEVSEAFKQFHNYSYGNMLMAWFQCRTRHLPLGPMATYNKWKTLGRQVKKGEKALTLCVPRVFKRENDDGTVDKGMYFIYKRAWFVLAQTEGPELDPLDNPPAGELDLPPSLWDELDVKVIEFDHPNGNVFGYAKGREIAINPVIPPGQFLPTILHELAHVVLGHTAKETLVDELVKRQDLRELEAEATCYLVLAAHGRDEQMKYSRGYMQNWYKENAVPEKNAERIIGAAGKLMAALHPTKKENQ